MRDESAAIRAEGRRGGMDARMREEERRGKRAGRESKHSNTREIREMCLWERWGKAGGRQVKEEEDTGEMAGSLTQQRFDSAS